MSKTISGDQVFCPRCSKYVQLLRVERAARIAGVNRRTVYRYIEEGAVYYVKVAGKTYRICGDCLLASDHQTAV